MNRFLSRKFLLAVSAATGAAANGEWIAVGVVVLGYLAAEGIIDVKAMQSQDVDAVSTNDVNAEHMDPEWWEDDEPEPAKAQARQAVVAARRAVGFKA